MVRTHVCPPNDAERLKFLEDQNATLNKVLADRMREASALRELLSKEMVGPAAKREAVAHLQAVMGLSERRACSFVGADRKMIGYRSCRPPEMNRPGFAGGSNFQIGWSHDEQNDEQVFP